MLQTLDRWELLLGHIHEGQNEVVYKGTMQTQAASYCCYLEHDNQLVLSYIRGLAGESSSCVGCLGLGGISNLCITVVGWYVLEDLDPVQSATAT